MSQYSQWFQVLQIPYSSTVIVPVSRYPPPAWSLIQYLYQRKFSASVQQLITLNLNLNISMDLLGSDV